MALDRHSLERLRQRHRRWLGKHNLLDRPWFVLASAPNPTIPENIAERAAVVCINNAAATAARLGLPPPALTLRNRNKEWDSVAGVKLPLVLWMSDRNILRVYWVKLFVAKSRIGEIRTIGSRARRDIYTHMLGSDLSDVGHMHKPSAGMFAALYAAFVGVPEVILAGFSMGQDGYSYGSLPGIQIHREEDRFAMGIIAAQYPSVRTTESEVAEQTGIPLYK